MSAQTGDQQQVSKGLLITLGVVGAIGALFALWTFVLQPLMADDGGSDAAVADGGQASPEPGDATPAPSPSPSATPSPGGGDGSAQDDGDSGDGDSDGDGEDGSSADGGELDETVEVVNARDPFEQLVVDSSGGGATTEGTGTTNTDTTNTDTTNTSTGGSGGGSDGSGQDQADVGSTTITLVDIYTGDDDVQRASVEVNNTGYDVLEGETFADRFQLLDIADTCATMLFGDSRFTLCEGDAVRK